MPRQSNTIPSLVLNRRQVLAASAYLLGFSLIAPKLSWATVHTSALTEQAIKQLNQPVPGGVAVVLLGEFASAPQVDFEGAEVLVLAHKKQWYALVGIPLDAKPGAHQIAILKKINPQANQNKQTNLNNQGIETVLENIRADAAQPIQSWSFNVRDKTNPAQHITLKNKRQVNPNPADLARIQKELVLQNDAYATYTKSTPSNILFAPPVKGRLSSPFGLKRYFNGEARNPHSGLDFAAPTGTPVQSPAAGRIILIGDYFFNGKTIFIDHGMGLISMFCHLSSINKQVGDTVKQFDVMAKVGATGRATGPHLHWNVSLNNARVDPALFLTTR